MEKQQVAVLTIETTNPSICHKQGPAGAGISLLGRMSPLPWRPGREPKKGLLVCPARIAPGLGLLFLAGCTAEFVIIPPPAQVTVSQGLAPLQQIGPELSRPKPKTRSIVVKQTVPGLGQKAGGTVQGEFSPEFNKEFK